MTGITARLKTPPTASLIVPKTKGPPLGTSTAYIPKGGYAHDAEARRGIGEFGGCAVARNLSECIHSPAVLSVPALLRVERGHQPGQLG